MSSAIPPPRMPFTASHQIKTYTVPGMSCQHCASAIRHEVGRVTGVDEVDVALDSKRVTVRGLDLDDRAVRAAIGEAGYEAAS